MVKYLAKRIGRSLITLFIIICVVFILMRQMPIEGYFQNFDKLTEAQIQAGLEEQGLLDPMPVQLLHFFQNMLKGDFGVSHSYRVNVPVTEILADKLPISIKLGSLSILVSLILGIPLGTIMARFKSRIPDKLGTLFIVFIQAVPAAVYYLFIQMYGTLLLDIPLLFDESNWKSWILPVFSMSLGNIAYYGMWLRRYMVDESNKDYVRLAKAKGASGNSIMFRHIFRNAFVPMVQYLPSSFLNTVIGSIYVESLYSIPGMGGLLVTVIKGNDNNMVQAIVLLYATVGVIGLLLGDIMMVILDPRISLSGKEGER
ncbi:MAG: ABC transporter permease [Lachnospiraceae bacterium]|nr:ABC transporter permease [Lachnospiraceae bacterium]